MRGLSPGIDIDGSAVILDTLAIAAFPATELRQPVLSLQAQSETIIGALDTLFGSC